LLLKVLEGETDQSLSLSQLPFGDRALPNLADNIKCGNSLIGPDYFTGKMHPDSEEMKVVNAFAWSRGFPDAMKVGGFDCVIGNPPWVSLTGRFRNEICTDEQIQYLLTAYKGNTYMPNMYEYFVCKGTTLVREGGRFGYIVPDRLGFNRQFILLRERILQSFQIESLVYKMPFPGVTADTLSIHTSSRAIPGQPQDSRIRTRIEPSRDFAKGIHGFRRTHVAVLCGPIANGIGKANYFRTICHPSFRSVQDHFGIWGKIGTGHRGTAES
jgi:hypothetical protein